MDQTEILLTIAEIGVALAGFASLATVLGCTMFLLVIASLVRPEALQEPAPEEEQY